VIKFVLRAIVILVMMPFNMVWQFVKPLLQTDQNSPMTEVVGYGMQEKVIPNTTAIQKMLHPMNYPRNLLGFSNWGGGGYRVYRKRFIFGGRGMGGGDTIRTGQHDIYAESGMGSQVVGFRVIDLGFLRMYPYVGLGGGGLSVDVYEADADTQRTEPDPDKRLVASEHAGVIVDVGLGAEFKIGGCVAMIVGLHAGYVFAPKQLSTGSGREGFYARFVIGGATQTKDSA